MCNQRRVLNVGFGMGIIDGALQRRGPGEHVIIEAHPRVYEAMQAAGWTDKVCNAKQSGTNQLRLSFWAPCTFNVFLASFPPPLHFHRHLHLRPSYNSCE